MDPKKGQEPAGAKKAPKAAAKSAGAAAAPSPAVRGTSKAVKGGGKSAAGRGGGRGAKAAHGGGRGPKAAATGAAAAGAAAGGAADADEIMETAVSFQGTFTKDLRLLMYGHGDSECPLNETVDLVEDMMLEYVSNMMHKALEHTSRTLKKQVGHEDILHLVRKDRRKYGRVRELLAMQQEIKDARKGLVDVPLSLAEVEDADNPGGPAPEEAAAEAQAAMD